MYSTKNQFCGIRNNKGAHRQMQLVWISVHRFSCAGKHCISLFSVCQPDFNSYLPALQIDGKFQIKHTWNSFLFSLQRAVLRFCAFIGFRLWGHVCPHLLLWGCLLSQPAWSPQVGPWLLLYCAWGNIFLHHVIPGKLLVMASVVSPEH